MTTVSETSTATPTISAPPTAPTPRPTSHDQLDALGGSFTGITTLLVTAGIGLHRFTKSNPQLKAAYDQLQHVIGVMDERANDEAELEALVAEHDLQVEEWDTSTLDESLRDKFLAHYMELKDGARIIVVPLGQDPAQRLHAVRALITHQGVTA